MVSDLTYCPDSVWLPFWKRTNQWKWHKQNFLRLCCLDCLLPSSVKCASQPKAENWLAKLVWFSLFHSLINKSLHLINKLESFFYISLQVVEGGFKIGNVCHIMCTIFSSFWGSFSLVNFPYPLAWLSTPFLLPYNNNHWHWSDNIIKFAHFGLQPTLNWLLHLVTRECPLFDSASVLNCSHPGD